MAATESNRASNQRTRPQSPESNPESRPDEQESKPGSNHESIKLFLGYLSIAGLVLVAGLFLFYRAEMADATASMQPGAPRAVVSEAQSVTGDSSGPTASEPNAQGAGAERRGTLMYLWLFGLVLFAVMAVGAWFLADARVKWRRERERAKELADFDRVTELPNRALFFDRLERIHLHSARYDRRYGLILLDLDGFGEVNDRFGYSDGDQLLIRVGRMLSHRLRNSDTVARVGGDEFAVLLTEVSDADAAMSLGQKVVAAVAAPIRLPGGDAEITASVGVAVFPDHGSSVDDMLRAADEAMDRAKREGQGRCLLALSPSLYPQAEDLAASLVFEESSP